MKGPEESMEIFENETERKSFAGLEQDLAKALARMEAPAGFADRVVARAAGERSAVAAATRERGRLLVMPMRHWRGWAAGALAAVIVLGAFEGQRIHQEQQRRVVAQRQFETAERITDQTLEHTRQQLERAGVSLDGAE